MDTISKPVSEFIISLFKEWFPAAARDPAMTALIMGLVIGSCLTWFIYQLVHKGRINGLEAEISGLKGTKNILEERIKHKDEEIQRLTTVPIISPPIQHEPDKYDLFLKFETYAHTDIKNKRTTVVGVKVTNTSDRWLQHCSIRIENIRASDPRAPAAVFSNSKLKGSLPTENFFKLAALDNKDVPIAKFDSISGGFENLGIELLCFSTREYPALDIGQSYILTIVGVAEIGIPNQREYKVWVDGPFSDQKLHFEEV